MNHYLLIQNALPLQGKKKKKKRNAQILFCITFVDSDKSITFASNMTSHASRRTAHPGRSSSFYMVTSDKIDR